jgi:hypothetical protein
VHLVPLDYIAQGCEFPFAPLGHIAQSCEFALAPLDLALGLLAQSRQLLVALLQLLLEAPGAATAGMRLTERLRALRSRSRPVVCGQLCRSESRLLISSAVGWSPTARNATFIDSWSRRE